MPEKDEKSIEDVMVDSIAIGKVRDLVSDIAEVGLDSILDSGLLKDFPLIGIIAKTVGAAFAIRDRIFAKKVLSFLAQLDDIPQHKKQEFVDSLKDAKERRKVGETLILLIDRLDDIGKAEILGRLFSAHIEQKISYDDFRRLSTIVSRVFIQDLQVLLEIHMRSKKGQLTDKGSYLHDELSAIGLLERPSALLLESAADRLTEYADKLVEYALNERLEENDDAKFDN
ncbi:MAG: hypothetical protein Q9P01_12045 [Anaerolineae bacterium]|nr:hypothetical protein [Anaerolineae bacterium]MDQ7035530.1 hypothetical protein [Anaerolineae bacterium]